MNGSNEAKPIFSFFAISDLHITKQLRGKTAGKRRHAWQWIEKQNFDFGIIAGDVTNGGAKEEFAIAQSEMELIMNSVPIFIGYGNHDYIPNDPGAVSSPESRADFSKWMQEKVALHGCKVQYNFDLQCYSTSFCGIQILFLDCAAAYPAAQAGTEQLMWLDECLTHSDNDRFRIVVSHFPLNNYVPGRTSRKQMSYVRDSLKQQRILEKHKNVLFISGHTHFALDSDSPSVLFDDENRIVFLNTASVGNVAPRNGNIKNGDTDNSSGSMGLCIEIFENEIVINGIDFQTGTIIPSCQFSFII